MIVLKFETDIKGTCAEPKHEGEIIISSYTWDITRYVSVNGTIRSPGLAFITELTLKKITDISSPHLFIHAASGSELGTATLSVLQAVDNNTDLMPFLVYTLERAIVTKYKADCSGNTPTEEFKLNFTKMGFKYVGFDGGKKTSEAEKFYDLLQKKTT